jgi:hypothetical protein
VNNNVPMLTPAPEPAEPTARRGGGGWRVPLAVFLVAFGLFALTARHGDGSWDYYTANYASWHLVETGSPIVGPTPIPELDGDPEAGVWIMETDNGYVISRFPGVIAIALPAYWIAHVVGQADAMTVLPGAFTAALASALALLLMFLALRTRVSERRAAAAVAVLGFATPVWTVSADAVWPHTVTLLGIAGMAWGCATVRWWAVGLFGGITLWGRLHAAVIVALLGVVLGWRRKNLSITLVIGSISAAFLALLCLWTKWMYGTWSPTGSYNDDVFDVAPQGLERLTNQLGMWVSFDRGILVWTPILVLLTPAVFRGWRDLPDWARTLLVGGLLYTVVQAVLITFTGGDSFYGYRLGIEFVVAATPAYAMSLDHLGSTARRWVTPVLTLQVTAIAFGALVDAFLGMDRAWTDNAFYYSMRETWPVGPILLAAVFCFVFVVRRRLGGRHPQAVEPADTAAHDGSGTVSSHSVP